MQVEAIYDQGHLEFAYPLQLKHQRVRLMVEVPDDEIVNQPNSYNLPPEVLARAQNMLEKYAAIVNAPLPPDADLPELSAEYQERLDAIELRAQLRQEQGRPV
ncbi:MAG: hypothetical protein Q8K38_14900 [Burkholderiaceae bacterium]|nr:hypothetical protein [Burkholderiaceae bacterium]MDZ4143678.1 hypothetical protein [Burkholderiales bacterium]